MIALFKKTSGVYNGCPPPPCTEHSECVPLRLWPHPQSNGQPVAPGGGGRVGTFGISLHRRGCQRAGGPQHRLPGRLQRDSAQGLLRPFLHCGCFSFYETYQPGLALRATPPDRLLVQQHRSAHRPTLTADPSTSRLFAHLPQSPPGLHNPQGSALICRLFILPPTKTNTSHTATNICNSPPPPPS